MAKREYPQSHIEPAHPMDMRYYRDLVAIYKHIREKYQERIDEAFDRASREIGFVVATLLPVVFEVGDKGEVKSVSMGAENLKGTLLERELTKALEGIEDLPIPIFKPASVSDEPFPLQRPAGSYKLYLFWFEGLKLELRGDWVEPVHFLIRPEGMLRGRFLDRAITSAPGMGSSLSDRSETEATPVPIPIPKPGQATLMRPEEKMLISAIDETYPELRLAERIAHGREISRQIETGPGVREPVHFRPADPGQISQLPGEMVAELISVLRRYGH